MDQPPPYKYQLKGKAPLQKHTLLLQQLIQPHRQLSLAMLPLQQDILLPLGLTQSRRDLTHQRLLLEHIRPLPEHIHRLLILTANKLAHIPHLLELIKDIQERIPPVRPLKLCSQLPSSFNKRKQDPKITWSWQFWHAFSATAAVLVWLL